jgi:hypothetical protein
MAFAFEIEGSLTLAGQEQDGEIVVLLSYRCRSGTETPERE